MARTVDQTRTSDQWERLYVSLRPDLTRSLVAATGGYDGVEDAIQDAFAKALRTQPESMTNPEGWFFTVALNCLRRARRRAAVFRPLTGEPSASTRELDAALDRNTAMRALRSLPERERTLLVAKYYVGLSQEEIARVLGMSRGTVSAAISRAVARLREIEEAVR